MFPFFNSCHILNYICLSVQGLITFNGPLDFANMNSYDYVVTAAETDGLLSSVFEVRIGRLYTA